MANGKHTPGPWRTRDNGRAWSIHGSGHHALAQVERDGSDQGRANARLIAAAPDLLAACEAFVGMIEKRFTRDMRLAVPEWYDLAVQAAQAIAKAKGKE